MKIRPGVRERVSDVTKLLSVIGGAFLFLWFCNITETRPLLGGLLMAGFILSIVIVYVLFGESL